MVRWRALALAAFMMAGSQGPSLLPAALAGLAILGAVSSESSSFCTPSATWPRSFSDEFDGPSLNTSLWSVYLQNAADPASGGAGQCGFGVGRFGRCDAANVYLENGSLVLKSDKLPAQQCNASEGCFNFTSGGVTSRDKATWRVGGGESFRLCVNAMLPGGASPGSGTGIWPAHWMMPNGICLPLL